VSEAWVLRNAVSSILYCWHLCILADPIAIINPAGVSISVLGNIMVGTEAAPEDCVMPGHAGSNAGAARAHDTLT
jgi:hypothetical protein